MIQYAPKLTYGPQVADWQERLNPERMRRQRVAQAQRIMKQHGVAALLEANQHNIRYLTALRGFHYPMCRYVLFFAEEDAVMYEHDGYYHQMPDQCPWIKEWRPARSWRERIRCRVFLPLPRPAPDPPRAGRASAPGMVSCPSGSTTPSTNWPTGSSTTACGPTRGGPPRFSFWAWFWAGADVSRLVLVI